MVHVSSPCPRPKTTRRRRHDRQRLRNVVMIATALTTTAIIIMSAAAPVAWAFHPASSSAVTTTTAANTLRFRSSFQHYYTHSRSASWHQRLLNSRDATKNKTTTLRPLQSSSSNNDSNYSDQQHEDLFAAVHRKEYEMNQLKKMVGNKTTDPVIMAMGYGQVSVSNMRLAKALRRVYEDINNPAHPDNVDQKKDDDDDDHDADDAADSATTRKSTRTRTTRRTTRAEQLAEMGLRESGLRRASFIVDIKRQSPSYPGQIFCHFDDASRVATAMVQLGADVVIVTTDYAAYGGDQTELKGTVRAVRQISKTAAVVMKDIVVDEYQLGLAKEAGADGIVLMSSVLGGALESFVNLATTMGLETIVECHTLNEVEMALDIMAPTILVNNYDRIRQELHPEQAIQLAGMFPGSGGPIICLATGGIQTVQQMKRHLAVGYDGIVVGRAVMGNAKAPEFIRAVRDGAFLPAELSQWGIDAEFDIDGNLIIDDNNDKPKTPQREATTESSSSSSSSSSDSFQ
jgi:indole-3-glycerol phosphate synthase